MAGRFQYLNERREVVEIDADGYYIGDDGITRFYRISRNPATGETQEVVMEGSFQKQDIIMIAP